MDMKAISRAQALSATRGIIHCGSMHSVGMRESGTKINDNCKLIIYSLQYVASMYM